MIMKRILRSVRGTATIETAIVMPLYMIVLWGLIYFGYATLTRQKQVAATAYAAWQPETQYADNLMRRFWPWVGEPQANVPAGNSSDALAGFTELRATEDASQRDVYYGTLIPRQVVAGAFALGGGGEDTFDRERLGVSLWNYALGEVHQFFEWVPGQGAVEQTRVRRNEVARYLNSAGSNPRQSGGAFVDADDASPPAPIASVTGMASYGDLIANALNGGGTHWLERRQSSMDATYQPPFFNRITIEEGAPPTTFTQYVAGDDSAPRPAPVNKAAFGLTGRNPNGQRLGAADGQSGEGIMNETMQFLGADPLPSLDAIEQATVFEGMTVRELWQRR